MNTQSPRKLRIAKRIVATIRHEGSKWILYTKDGSRKLGEHDTKKEALAQERAIHARGGSRPSPRREIVKDVPRVPRWGGSNHVSVSKRVSALEYLIGFLQDQREKWQNVLVDLSSLTGETQDEAIDLAARKRGIPKQELEEAVAQVSSGAETDLSRVAERLMASRTAVGIDHDFRALIGRTVSGKSASGAGRYKGKVVGVSMVGKNYKSPIVWVDAGKRIVGLKTFGEGIIPH